MADAFVALSADDRREALLTASSKTGRPAYLLEKDVWVVWTLRALYQADFGQHLVFKGGTSLSKAYGGLIKRFSEDIDLTYDIRQLLPDKMQAEDEEPIPTSKSQQSKWNSLVRERLPEWIACTVLPALQTELEASGLDAVLAHEGDKVRVVYEPMADRIGYISPEVVLEFGARSTGGPASVKDIQCDAAAALPQLVFPVASPRVMAAERTFWEKATAAHVYCLQGKLQLRYARHWHDLAQLWRVGIAAAAIANRELATQVARHKQAFFETKDSERAVILYAGAIEGSLRLVPDGELLEHLSEDYAAMIDGGMFEEAPAPFDQLMEQCRAIEAAVNAQAATP